MILRGFPPIEARAAQVLILGSMPGEASLKAAEYYAHPHNLFWPFMEELLGIPRADSYAKRTKLLAARGVALWDVIGSCRRQGSLDSAIRDAVPNDFPAFLRKHRSIRAVFLNGRKAEATFLKHAAPMLPAELPLIVLPSTSPANASIRRADKLKAWARIGEYLTP